MLYRPCLSKQTPCGAGQTWLLSHWAVQGHNAWWDDHYVSSSLDIRLREHLMPCIYHTSFKKLKHCIVFDKVIWCKVGTGNSNTHHELAKCLARHHGDKSCYITTSTANSEWSKHVSWWACRLWPLNYLISLTKSAVHFMIVIWMKQWLVLDHYRFIIQFLEYINWPDHFSLWINFVIKEVIITNFMIAIWMKHSSWSLLVYNSVFGIQLTKSLVITDQFVIKEVIILLIKQPCCKKTRTIIITF